MTTTPTQAARVRSRVDHPIIDADGHFVELGPLLQDEVISYVEDAGGPALPPGPLPRRREVVEHRARRRCHEPFVADEAVALLRPPAWRPMDFGHTPQRVAGPAGPASVT